MPGLRTLFGIVEFVTLAELQSSLEARWIRGTTEVTKPKRPRDLNEWAKRMVDIATGEATDREPENASAPRGRAGGAKGGPARAASLDPQRRREIARKAADARWEKK